MLSYNSISKNRSITILQGADTNYHYFITAKHRDMRFNNTPLTSDAVRVHRMNLLRVQLRKLSQHFKTTQSKNAIK